MFISILEITFFWGAESGTGGIFCTRMEQGTWSLYISKDTLPTLCQRALTDRQTDMRQALFAEHNKEKPSKMMGTLVCASKCSTLSHVMKLLGQTTWHPALSCALISLLLLTWFLTPKLLLVCRGRVKEAKNRDGTGTCVCKAFGELSPVLCFLHRISNSLIPKLACGRAGW